jgi:peptidoglycan hydrolase CwlO-like protein
MPNRYLPLIERDYKTGKIIGNVKKPEAQYKAEVAAEKAAAAAEAAADAARKKAEQELTPEQRAAKQETEQRRKSPPHAPSWPYKQDEDYERHRWGGEPPDFHYPQ